MEFKMSTDVEKEYLKKFIQCYKSHPILWDNTAPEYQDKKLRQAVHYKLLDIMKMYCGNAKLDDVKRKINSLRSGYRREWHKIQRSIAAGDEFIHKPNLWWYHLLDFIQEDNEAQTEEIIYYSDVANESVFTESFSEIKQPDVKKKRSLCRVPDIIEPIEKTIRIETVEKSDDSDKIVEVWALKLRKMEPTQQMLAEKFINEILFEGQMGTLHRNSMQLNIIERLDEYE